MQATGHRFSSRRQLHPRGISILLAVLVFFAAEVGKTRANGNEVDLALVLAVDTSRSVNAFEYDLQRGGLARAIRHPDVIAAIRKGRLKRIAVTVV